MDKVLLEEAKKYIADCELCCSDDLPDGSWTMEQLLEYINELESNIEKLEIITFFS